MSDGKLQVIVGGLFGSEAKGHIAGYLAGQEPHWSERASQTTPGLLAIRVGGPNAGHSVVNPLSGAKHALRQIPAAAVTNPNAALAIGAGSEVSIAVLATEIENLERDGIAVRHRLIVDPAATILDPDHAQREVGLTDRIGSTAKGIGAARADRIMRVAGTVGMQDAKAWHAAGLGRQASVATSAHCTLRHGGTVQVEGTQGYGLGLHTGYYPYTTSSDCTAVDFLSMTGISPWGYGASLEVWVVFRPYPIRVAGNSGPLMGETSWQELGLAPEYTTVTKKMRRVGAWDPILARAAVIANGAPDGYPYRADEPTHPVRVALTMADQIEPTIAGVTEPKILLDHHELIRFIDRIEGDLLLPVELVTTSDRTCVDLRTSS